jgi:hypothetical protein
MDDFFDGFGNGSAQDNFELAALKYFEELDRKAEKPPFPPSRPAPAEAAPAQTPPVPDEDVMPDLADSGVDSVILSLMAEPVKGARPNPPAGRTARPIPRKKAERKTERPAPADPRPLSELARQAAALFDALPTEDQLLAYSLLQKLAKAAEKSK